MIYCKQSKVNKIKAVVVSSFYISWTAKVPLPCSYSNDTHLKGVPDSHLYSIRSDK